MSGPSKTPSSILAARGSWRAEANPDEPIVATAAPDCPTWLTGEAKAEWTRIVPSLITRNTLSVADRGHLAGMCYWWGVFVKAQKACAGKVKFKGNPVDHPRVILIQSWKEYSKAAQQFGLSPAAKARVQSSPDEKKPDAKARFFKGPRLADPA